MKKFYNASATEGGGGLTPEGIILASIQANQKRLDELMSEQKQLAKPGDIADAVKKAQDEINTEVAKLNGLITDQKASFESIKVQVDELDKKAGKMRLNGAPETKSFSEALAEEVELKGDDIDRMLKDKKGSVVLQLKTVGVMTTATNLTGDGVATYNTRQGIKPTPPSNFRDFIPTITTPTGIYVTYRETGSEGGIDWQLTEGEDKPQIDYDLTEVRVVQNYLAGVVHFSKQMMKQLPFLQGTLSRMLMRDFFIKENAEFFAKAAAAATGSGTTSETDDVLQIIDHIAALRTANYSPSVALIGFDSWAAVMKELFAGGNYAGAGSINGSSDGAIRIGGVPVIPASFVPADKILVMDTDYIERVESESVNVQFSYENDKNFQRNLVTARVECYEELNVLRPDALIYGDFGNAT